MYTKFSQKKRTRKLIESGIKARIN